MKLILSQGFREQLGRILGEIQYSGAHYAVQRYQTPAAIMVPPGWYWRALRTIADPSAVNGIPAAEAARLLTEAGPVLWKDTPDPERL